MTIKSEDVKFMKRALILAVKGGAYVSPNPRVGAVLVKNGRIVGEGAHGRYGGPHAEIVALGKAGHRARGATLYVTLEPCDHFGKTPPCTKALIRAGVRRVMASLRDPFPLVAGRGFARLRRAGVQVDSGLLEKDARRLNENFFFSMRYKRPKVILKAAISLDGKIAAMSGRSKWITGEKARRKVHEMRAAADALLVGSRTAIKDNPSLTVRLPGFKRMDGRPFRVVLDTKLRTNPRLKIFKGPQKTVVFTSPGASLARQKGFLKKGIQVFRVPLSGKMLSLKAVLSVLHSLDVRTLFVEGGARVHSSFLGQKMADEVVLFIAPKILGGDTPSWVEGRGVENPNRANGLKNVHWEKIGGDYLLRGDIKYGSGF